MSEIICPQCKALNKDTALFCSECGASFISSASPSEEVDHTFQSLQAGFMLQDRYRIVEELGRGGLGAVYRTWDTRLNKAVVVKENIYTTQEAQRQFAREALVLASLSHPNLPRVIDHFSLPGQGQYLVMDFVEGEDLETLARTRGKIPVEQALSWIIQVADALEYLHGQEPPIFHRDIKPANVRITPNGKAMLVDFGLVKVSEPQLKTALGAKAISAGYAPPEQYGKGRTDARTDIYALSSILYRLITRNDPMESVQRISGDILLTAEQVDPKVPRLLSQTIERGMALDPIHRYQSAKEFKASLKEFLDTSRAKEDVGITSGEERGRPLEVQPPIGAATQPLTMRSEGGDIGKTVVVDSESRERDRKGIAISGMPLLGRIVDEASTSSSVQASGGVIPSGVGHASGGLAGSGAGEASGGVIPAASDAGGGIPGGPAIAKPINFLKFIPRWLIFSCAGGAAVISLFVIALTIIVMIGGSDANQASPTEIPSATAPQAQLPATQIPQEDNNIQPSPPSQGLQATAVVYPLVTQQAAIAVGPVVDLGVVTTAPPGASQTVDQTVISFLTSLGISATPVQIHGPESGSILHDPNNGRIEGRCTSVNVKNFMLHIFFSAPYSSTSGMWDFGTIFRVNGNGDLRVVVSSDKGWQYIQHILEPEEFRVMESGKIRKLGANKGETNSLRFVALDNVGWLYVNHEEIAKLDLGKDINPGAICVASGFYQNSELPEEETPYLDFTVWELR